PDVTRRFAPLARDRVVAASHASARIACTSLRIGLPSAGTAEGARFVKRLAWLTDIHLNFLRRAGLDAFFASLPDADAFAITGDMGEAHDVVDHLRAFAGRGPVYFVLGNHDFYRGSIAGVRHDVRELCSELPDLHWMPDSGIVPLNEATCLVGHDGWGD